MSFLGRRSRLILTGAVIVLFGVGVVAAVPALAKGENTSVSHGIESRGATLDASAVGAYNAFESNPVTPNAAVTANAMTINANGTWSQSQKNAKDTGYWVSQGKTVALVVTSSNRGNTGCVFLGTVTATGINKATRSKQGPYNCGGLAGTWYATKTNST
jgi:hypothetical protein